MNINKKCSVFLLKFKKFKWEVFLNYTSSIWYINLKESKSTNILQSYKKKDGGNVSIRWQNWNLVLFILQLVKQRITTQRVIIHVKPSADIIKYANLHSVYD